MNADVSDYKKQSLLHWIKLSARNINFARMRWLNIFLLTRFLFTKLAQIYYFFE